MVEIKTTDKIEVLLGYLQNEISKSRLDPIYANMYLYAMWNSRNENEVILRPKWTFAISDFGRYLNFYKKFNLLSWNGSVTKFTANEDLYQSNDITINVEDKDTIKSILDIGKEIQDFQNYYSEA